MDPAISFAKSYLGSLKEILNKLPLNDLAKAMEEIKSALDSDRCVFIAGNGGSASTASHIANDFTHTVPKSCEKRIKALALTDNIASITAIANDLEFADVFSAQLRSLAKKGDILIVISGSGNSLNVVKALEYARGKGAKTVAICGYAGGKIKEIADLSVHAEVQDMEVSEDIHNLVMVHCVKQMLTKELKNNKVGEEYAKRVAL